VRLGAAAAVLVVASYTSVLASVSSLPGQPLYSVKRADEAITLGLTRDDLSRAFVLLQQAGARLDEVSRLAGTGQVQPAADLLQQYASTLERATASLSGAPGAEPRRAEFEAGVRQQREQLDSIGREAPPPLRSSIAQAQAVATQELAQAQGISVAGAVAPNPTPDPTANSANPAPTSNPNANPNPTTTVAPRPAASPLPAASPSAGAATRPAASPSPESRP
jgi:hypothetical protein